MQSSAHSYRPEIDGLRTIAVMSVILFHFAVPGFSGGFVGVDIFFVISGFLIGGILWGELLETGRVSLRHFYMRRIRRLAPAYFAMAAASLIVAYIILLPFEFREFGKSLIAATVYLSNVHFWREAGYFDTAAEDKVLLHTWSLSVEEQFYIFLPLLILLMGRWPRILIGTLVVTFFVSLIACVVITPVSYTSAFYLFPFRAWELLTGVLLAVAGQSRQADWNVSPALSWMGMGVLLLSIFMIQPGPDFPGAVAIAPVVGTAMILMNGQNDNLINRLLSHRVAVFVGLISYSLYIWHWPILTLSQYWRGEYSGPLETLFWMAVVFAVAFLSWALVETPFRRARTGRAMPMLFGTVVGSSVLLVAGGMIYIEDGMEDRFPPQVRTHIQASADFNQDWSRCHVPTQGAFAGVEICPIGPEGTPEVLIWGDSHARAFKEGLEQIAWDMDAPAVLIWHAGCPPLFEIFKVESAATPAQDAACTRANLKIRDALEDLEGIKRLLLIGRWSYYANGSGIGRDVHNTIRLNPLPDGTLPDVPQAELFEQALAFSTKAMSANIDEVFVLRQVPEMPYYDSREMARNLAHGHMTPDEVIAQSSVSFSELAERVGHIDAALRALARADRIVLLDPWSQLCDGSGCQSMIEGQSVYFDNNHITNDGARKLRHIFAPVFTTRAEDHVRANDD